ncbi:hypothetical protein [Alkalimarinus alittae]|uniref:Uncharacterized protein n=1 Tax=Alkalimarinus alittae TaxID=2961619 RepID=A0ABY6N5M0_9ALTE|nr:hypothetical protein [Alkalimarinus alittae]UZE97279.1 hypothetical protein NKI27_05880 [Alkalimarinus alittae]
MMSKLSAIQNIVFGCILAGISQSLFALPKLQPQEKSAPVVTFDKVEELFGHNLDTSDFTLMGLLLAIGMDHTSKSTPNTDQDVGIPFIVAKGPNYWVSRLSDGERGVDVLVNNALLLLFTKEKIPNAKEGALKLMEAASEKGYWPADYYVADYNLTTHLTRDFSEFSVPPKNINTDQLTLVAKDTMNRFNSCADMGFAPCQFRIGYWLANSPRSLGPGLEVLRQAIKTAQSDTRYEGLLDDATVIAAREIVLKGEQVGIDQSVLDEYTNLIEIKYRKMSL